MKLVARLFREPLLHFLAIGGVIFLFFGGVTGPGQKSTDTIVVGPEQIDQLTKGFQAVWRRTPTGDELNAMIDEFVREEIYYREALALGLDRDDTVVRRRLRQKMEFLTDTAADVLEPAPGELESYFAANEQAYRNRPKLAFEQIYLGETASPEAVLQALEALRSDPKITPSALGERTLLPAQLRPSPPGVIDGVFGQGYFERLAALPAGVWSGPVTSAYGVHLVRIDDFLPERTPPLEAVRDVVLRDWKAAKAMEIRDRHFAQLRERYDIEIHRPSGRLAEDD